MSTVNHAAEALALTRVAAPTYVTMACAQVHATLALAEQQRLANIIALASQIPDYSASKRFKAKMREVGVALDLRDPETTDE